MIIISFFRYELWRFINPQLIKMMWAWRCLWLGWKATPRLIFMPSQADICCRYLIARLDHYAPAGVLGKESKRLHLKRIVDKYNINTNFV